MQNRKKVQRWFDYHSSLGGEVWLVDWNNPRYHKNIYKFHWVPNAQIIVSENLKDLARVKRELINGPHRTSNYDLYIALKRLWMLDQEIQFTSASRWEPWRDRTRLHPGQSRIISRVIQNKPALSIHFVYEHGIGKGFWEPVKQLTNGMEVWENLSYDIDRWQPDTLRFGTMNVPEIQQLDSTIDYTKYTKPWIYFDWIHGETLQQTRKQLSDSILS